MPRTKKFCEKEVLQKAIRLFWEKGYCNTSMQDLVDFLGINRASMYDTYGDKHSLLLQALKVYKEGVVVETRNFLAKQSSVKQGIYLLLKNSTSYDPKNNPKGCFIVNLSSEMGANDSEVLSVIEKNREEMEDILSGFLQKGIEQGEMVPGISAHQAAAYLHTFMGGLIVKSKVLTSPSELDEIIQTVIRSIFI